MDKRVCADVLARDAVRVEEPERKVRAAEYGELERHAAVHLRRGCVGRRECARTAQRRDGARVRAVCKPIPSHGA